MFNTTLVPSLEDLIFLVPRLAQKASAFVFPNNPFHVKSASAITELAGRVTDLATNAADLNQTLMNETSALPQMIQNGTSTGIMSWATLDSVRSISSMFSYFSSKWALTAFIVVSHGVYNYAV